MNFKGAARLVGIGAVVLQRRVVQVQHVERQGQVVVDAVTERRRQVTGVVLVFGRAAVQPHEEVRAKRVRETGAEPVVLVVADDVVRVPRRTHQVAVPRLFRISVRVVRLESEAIAELLLIRKLEALHLSAAVRRRRDRVRVEGTGADIEQADRVVAKSDIVRQIHVEQARRQQRLRREIPLERRVDIRGADRLQVRIAAVAGVRRVLGADRPAQRAVIRTRHRSGDREARDEILRQIELEVGARQDVGVSMLDRLLIERAERGGRDCPRHLRARCKRRADIARDRDVDEHALLCPHRAYAEVAAPARSVEISHRVRGCDSLLEREFARPETTHDRIAIRIKIAPAFELTRGNLPHVAREVSTQAVAEVGRIGFTIPVRQVRRVEGIEREVRALRDLLGIALVFRGTEAGLHAGPRTHAEHIQAVDLAIRFLVLRFRGTRAEDPVERRAGEVRGIAVRERYVGRG